MKSVFIKQILLCFLLTGVFDAVLYFSSLYSLRIFLDIVPEDYYHLISLLKLAVYLTITLIVYSIFRKTIEFSSNSEGVYNLKSIIAFFFVALFFRLFIDFIINFDYIFKRLELSSSITQRAVDLNFWVNLVTSVILIPILEELFFRGVIFEKLRAHLNLIVSAIISSLLFSIGHLNPLQLHFSLPIASFIFGLILAIVYAKYKLKGAIILHSIYNVLVLFLGLGKSYYIGFLHYLEFDWRYWVFIILSGVTLLLIVRDVTSFKQRVI